MVLLFVGLVIANAAVAIKIKCFSNQNKLYNTTDSTSQSHKESEDPSKKVLPKNVNGISCKNSIIIP